MQAAFSNNPITCYIVTREKEIIGFACYEATARNFFGPMAVLESERRKGNLGERFETSEMRKHLIRAAFYQARQDGVTVLEI